MTPLAYFVDAETAAVDYVNGKRRPADGADLRGAAAAGPQRTEPAGLRLLRDPRGVRLGGAGHLQAWESEEYCKERLGLDAALGSIDRSKLNVNGSSLAAGHPFAATGGRIVAQLAKQLAEKKAGDRHSRCAALISICAAGGPGVAAILEA